MLDNLWKVVWRYTKLLFGASLILFGLGSLLPPGPRLTHERLLETQGVRTSAKVIDIDVESRTSYSSTPPLGRFGAAGGFVGGFAAGAKLGRIASGDTSAGGSTINSYWAMYEFKTADGETVSGRYPIAEDERNIFKVGTDLDILYHPKYPKAYRLTEFSRPIRTPTLFDQLQLVAITSALGGFMVWRNWPSSLPRIPYPPAPSPSQPPVGAARLQRTVRSAPTPAVSPPPSPKPPRRGMSGSAPKGFGQRG